VIPVAAEPQSSVFSRQCSAGKGEGMFLATADRSETGGEAVDGSPRRPNGQLQSG
jgi:hypothetical protein